MSKITLLLFCRSVTENAVGVIEIENLSTKEITIDNIVYKLKHDEVKISVKEMRLIEKFIIDNDSKYIGDVSEYTSIIPTKDFICLNRNSHVKL